MECNIIKKDSSFFSPNSIWHSIFPQSPNLVVISHSILSLISPSCIGFESKSFSELLPSSIVWNSIQLLLFFMIAYQSEEKWARLLFRGSSTYFGFACLIFVRVRSRNLIIFTLVPFFCWFVSKRKTLLVVYF